MPRWRSAVTIAGERGELGAQCGGEFTGASAATPDIDGESVTRGFAEAEQKGAGELPVFETPGIGCEFERVRGDPLGTAHINIKRMVATLEGAVGNVKKTDAARAAEKFARRGGKEIAAQARDINGNFADGLAGVEQVGDASGLAEFTKSFDGLHEAGIGGHPRDGEEAHARVAQEFTHRLGIDTALGEIRGAADFDALAACQREIGKLIGNVIVARGDDDVAGTKIESSQRLKEGDGGIFNHGDVARVCAEKLRYVRIGSDHRGFGFIGTFVAAEHRFALQMRCDCIKDGSRHQAGAGVIEMDAFRTTGSVVAPLSEQVFHERVSSSVPASTTRLTPRVTLFRKQFTLEAGGKLLSNWQVYQT